MWQHSAGNLTRLGILWDDPGRVSTKGRRHRPFIRRRADQPPEKRLLSAGIEQMLGVPLNTQYKRWSRPFDRLYHVALVARRNAQPNAKLIHRLTVQGVDAHRIGARKAGQMRAGFDADLLARQDGAQTVTVLVDAIGILVQATAQRDIDHLAAPANAQNGFTCLKGLQHQPPLQGIAPGVQPRRTDQLPTIKIGGNVIAAANDHRINRTDIGLAPINPAHRAPARHPDVERDKRKDTPARAARRGDSDQRSAHVMPRVYPPRPRAGYRHSAAPSFAARS